MNVSATPTSCDPWQANLATAINQRNTDMTALGSSLQANDLSGAQQSFAAVMHDRQEIYELRKEHGLPTHPTRPVINDLNTLQGALKTGDLSTAKSDYTKLLTDLQRASQHRHHHGGARGALATTLDNDGDDATTAAADDSSPLDLIA